MTAAAQRTSARKKPAKKRSTAAKAPAHAVPSTAEQESCFFCGAIPDEEELALQAKRGRLVCPGCGRVGCYECMPSGRGCVCPECEEGGPQE